MTVDTDSLRHLLRQLSKNCDLQFVNSDIQTGRLRENYSVDCNCVSSGSRWYDCPSRPGRGSTSSHPLPQRWSPVGLPHLSREWTAASRSA